MATTSLVREFLAFFLCRDRTMKLSYFEKRGRRRKERRAYYEIDGAEVAVSDLGELDEDLGRILALDGHRVRAIAVRAHRTRRGPIERRVLGQVKGHRHCSARAPKHPLLHASSLLTHSLHLASSIYCHHSASSHFYQAWYFSWYSCFFSSFFCFIIHVLFLSFIFNCLFTF